MQAPRQYGFCYVNCVLQINALDVYSDVIQRTCNDDINSICIMHDCLDS
jgi:hypothetical protein